jgi:N-methylhydantoinase A/oxoprolinase/acetone carboxylase beta subunit
MRAAFEKLYLKLYGRVYRDLPLEIMNFRLSASARRHVTDMGEAKSAATGDGKVGTRRAFCPRKRAWMEFAVHRRGAIAPGLEVPGPAIVEENESTTVVPSGATARVDAHGSLIVKLARDKEQPK